jgi:FeS assembly SUF system protein
MNDEKSISNKSLTVLPHSGKIQELRQAFNEPRDTGSDSKPAIEPVIKALAAQQPLVQKVIGAIRTVYDPEIPVNIYDLGLIYRIDVTDDAKVAVKMTLTAPGCPVAGSMPAEVEAKIENIAEVKSAQVELVWDPPWTKDRMSEAAMLELNL